MQKGGVLVVSALLALAGWVDAAIAQEYPAKPVKIMVPYAAGGAPDVIARLVGQRLSEVWSQQFVVENRTGAGGITATVAVAKAPADGYTLLVADIAQLAINPYLFSKLPYDTLKDLAPISLAAVTPMFVAVNPTAQINSFEELVSKAKAQPGRLSYGSAGIGSVHHIAMESINAGSAIQILHVPYKGSGQSVPAFLGGEVQVVVSALPALGPHVRAGKVKLLAVTAPHRFYQAPEVPSVAEFLPGYDFASEIGFLAPAGTPPALVSKLSAEIVKALKHPDVQSRLAAVGSESVGTTPQAYTENIRRNLEKYSTAVRISGAKAD
jgi:tripartite-type tricarboxylate transporter receptor subunit TctC